MIIGADTGGTFTDFVAMTGDGLQTFKTRSTPVDFSEAVDIGLARMTSGRGADELVHASTVATNALLERTGRSTALVTTAGFGDVLLIGRQQRPSLYDLSARPAAPLIPRERCFEVAERVAANGAVLVALTDDEIARTLDAVVASGATSIAVCLLFSFLFSDHERRIGRLAAERGLAVSLSSDVAPEFREYERASTTVADAFVAPGVARYLRRVAERAERRGVARVRVVVSSGASLDLDAAVERPVQTVLSGPAAGAMGALAAARDVLGPEPRAISLDMGGTSTDAALFSGRPATASATSIAGCPLLIPVVDIHTVGAGGGSIAWIDSGGALRVGPRSAGADPGPAAYGAGGPATVTDANLVLGRLRTDRFLGGEVPLDLEAARTALETVARTMGTGREAAAHAVVAVVNAAMERALRVISVERGHDPRDHALIAFGGAGGLHACALADALGIDTVIVPRDPGVLSALGAATAEIALSFSRTVMTSLESADDIAAAFDALARDARAAAGFATADPERVERAVDARYQGQSYALTIPWEPDREAVKRALHASHERRFGFAVHEAAIEVVTVRLRLIARPTVEIPRAAAGDRPLRDAIVDDGVEGPVVDRLALAPDEPVAGPAVFVEPYATTWLAAGWRARVEAHGHLVLSAARA